MAVIKHVQLTPTKTYATPENAVKAVEKRVAEWVPIGGTKDTQVFNVIVMQHSDGRYFPVICHTSICPDGMQLAIWSGFNVIN